VKAHKKIKKEMKWHSWKESVLMYLNTQIGQTNIPLSCIIREDVEPEPYVNFTTNQEELKQLAINYGKVHDFL
jgi:hypothetical protein